MKKANPLEALSWPLNDLKFGAQERTRTSTELPAST